MTTPRQPTMRAALLTAAGGPEVIRVQEVPRPSPGPGEVCVRIHTSALNRADLLQRAGHYPAPPGAPGHIGGIEFAGEVDSLGTGVTAWHPGDRVFAICGGGAHAEYVAAPSTTLVRIPDALSWVDAGAIPEAFMTAHDAMISQAGLRPGEVVLVHAIASGVGLAASQLAAAMGARVYGTTRSSAKLAVARENGMSDGLVVDRDLSGLRDAVFAFTAGAGANVVLDLLGGAYLPASVEAAAPQGRIMLIGAIAGAQATLDVRRILGKRLTLRGTVLRSRSTDEKAEVARAFDSAVVPLLAAGQLRPNVDRVFQLSDIATAHEWVEANSNAGKVVINMM